MLNQENNFYLISLSILITCLLGNVWILKEKVKCFNHCWELKGYEFQFLSIKDKITER